jgi:lysophospholipase L1-like esterase
MPSVTLVNDQGQDFLVDNTRDFNILVYGRGWLPKTGTVESNYATLVGAAPVDYTPFNWIRLTDLNDPDSPASVVLRAAFGRPELLGRRRTLPRPSTVDQVMATAPTVGALATATAITNALWWPSVESGMVATDRFTYIGGGSFTAVGTTFPDYHVVRANSLTSTNSATAPFSVEFWFDGTTLEINTKGGGRIVTRVDDQLVSASPVVAPVDGTIKYLPLTFATRAWRRITVESNGVYFGGVRTGPNDTILPVEVRGPRCVVIGDSFTEGTGSDAASMSWPHRMGRLLGWRDLWRSGVGGTGYLNPGSAGRVKFRDRLVNDVIAHAPDVVVWAGGINDYATYTASQIEAEAAACFQAVADALPGVVQIAVSPFWRGGPETFPATLLEARDAIRAAAVAKNVSFIDVLEIPLSAAPVAGVLTSAIANAATSFTSDVAFARGTAVEIGAASGTERIRRLVTGVSGAGPYTHTVTGGMTPFASGLGVRQVGRPLWSGSGRVGATTGSGNSDLIVSSDGTHPSQVGHEAIGTEVATQIASAVLAP